MPEQKYYVMTKETNQPVGPMDEREIRQWISQRFLSNEDLITRAGDAKWIAINQSPFAALMTTGSYPSVNRDMGRPNEYLQNFNAYPAAQPQPDSSILLIRWVALLIDSAIAVPFIFLAFIPIINLLMAPLVCAYFVSRDVLAGNGQSLGKKAMGLKVEKSDGTPFTWADSVRRNAAYFVMLVMLANLIPYLGWIITAVFFKIVFLTETISVIATGKRIGDHLGTTYVTKAY